MKRTARRTNDCRTKKHAFLVILFSALAATAGCLGPLGGEPTPVSETPRQTTDTTATPTQRSMESPTHSQTPVDESLEAALERFAASGESFFEDNSNLTNVDIYREDETANLTISFGLPDASPDAREESFEYALEVLVDSHHNFVENGSESYQPNHIIVETDYGSASASMELLELYIDDKLDQKTVAYIWAGKFDAYTELGDLDNASHASREERLAYTARLVEREMESNGTYLMNVETEVEDETLYVKYEHTEDSPNPSWPVEDTAVAYRKTIARVGPDYMPTNGIRAYDYFPNGTAQATFLVRNRWVVSEYVGIRPIGESSLNGLNSIRRLNGPHEGPP